MPCPTDRTYSYLHKEAVLPGQRVGVPFARRVLVGVCLACSPYEASDQPQKQGEKRGFTLKHIKQVIDQSPVLTDVLLRVGRWMAKYYHHPIGEVFKAMLPGGGQGLTKQQFVITEKGRELIAADGGRSDEALVLSWLFKNKGYLSEATIRQRRKLHEQNHGPIRTSLWKKLQVEAYMERRVIFNERPRQNDEAFQSDVGVAEGVIWPELKPAQRAAFQNIIAHLGVEEGLKPILLFGVTGSGKTELYMQVIRNINRTEDQQAQALVMVPEISLTPQMTANFERRFPEQVAVVHSGMSDAQRWEQMGRIRDGRARVLIGPRSATFAAFKNLKLIIVDEEHDSSYKQTASLSYHGRDVAVLRASFEGIPIILGSATPSMESYFNAQQERYHLVSLTERISQNPLPKVKTVARGKKVGLALPSVEFAKLERQGIAARSEALNETILEELQAVLDRGEQAMVVVNRRGFAFYLYDESKNEVLACPNCSISLTYHLKKSLLRCHYCDYSTTLAEVYRQRPNSEFFAMGDGSQKLEQILQQCLPGAVVKRLDADTIVKRDSLASVLDEFRSGKINVLVGTQILAKGHDFPNVTLMVMLEVDQMLNLPDFRASERTFQLMVQAAGRVGRADLAGQVLVQSSRADQLAVKAGLNHDFLGFAQKEIELRKSYGYPPFTKMISMEFSSEDEAKLQRFCNKLEAWFSKLVMTRPHLIAGLKVLGPAIPAIERVRQRYRRALLLVSANVGNLHRFLDLINAEFSQLPAGIRKSIDVDPQSLL